MRSMERLGAVKWLIVTASLSVSRAYESVVQAWVRWRVSLPYPLQQVDESIGDYGERLAALYLERSGYVILERSMSTRMGEIDVIAAWRGKQIVFVEVKTWAQQRINAGGPADAVDDVKQRKITNTALTYMKRHGLLETAGRMDVIEVTFAPETRKPLFRHFVNAFEAAGQFQMFS